MYSLIVEVSSLAISMLWNDLVLHITGIRDCCQDIWFAEHSSHIIGIFFYFID